MVFDNRLTNEVDKDLETKETDKVADVNAQIDNIDLEERVIRNVDKKSGEIKDVMDMRDAFSNIREEVQKAHSSAELTELFRQAGSLIKLLDTSAFEEKVGDDLDEIRQVAEEEFARTAHELNSRANKVGAKSHYAEKWGG